MSEKVKLSIWLTDKGFYPTRSQATNAIKDGKVKQMDRTIRSRFTGMDGEGI